MLRRFAPALVFAGGGALAGCLARPAPPVEVVVAGCAEMWSGPRCRVVPPAALVVYVPLPGAKVHKLVGPGRVVGAHPLPEGVRLEVEVTAVGALRLEFESASGRRRFDLDLRPVPERPGLSAADTGAESGPADRLAQLSALRTEMGPEAQAISWYRAAGHLFREGQVEAAALAAQRSARAARGLGFRSLEVNAEVTAAFFFTRHLRRLPEAERAAARAMTASEGAAAGLRGRVLNVRALLAAEQGATEEALELYRVQDQWARRLGQSDLARAAVQNRTLTLMRVGRLAEAEAGMQALLQEDDSASGKTWANLGWVQLLLTMRGTGSATVAEESLARADAVLRAEDAGLVDRANTVLNRALLALRQERYETAEAHLLASRQLLPRRPAYLRLWGLEVDARLAMARGRWLRAETFWAELASLGAQLADADARLRAAVGAAELAHAQGHLDRALARYEEADARLAAAAAALSVSEDRGPFLAMWEGMVRRLVRIAVDAERPQLAFQTLRSARARVTRGLRTLDEQRDPGREDRVRFRAERQAFLRARSRIETDMEADWSRPEAELIERARQREAEMRGLQTRLDRALAALEPPGAPGPLRALTVAVVAAAPRSEAAPLAVYFDGVGYGAGPYGTWRPSLPSGPIHLWVWGGARGRDPYLDLVERFPVRMAVDVAAGPRVATGRALVVADPTDDLPNARAEGRAVAAVLRARALTVTLLEGPMATPRRVRDGLEGAELFHYAGHARHDLREPLSSALLLAAGGELSAREVLVLDRLPALVVLSGCDTAGPRHRWVASSGLAEAFVRGGVRGVVAALDEVRDRSARAFARALYAQPQIDEAAVRAAQLELRASGAADWSAFRFVGPR